MKVDDLPPRETTRTTETTMAFATRAYFRGAAALLVASQLACTSARPPAYDQFTVPPAKFLETIRTIALFSLSVEGNGDIPPCVDSIAERTLSSELEAAGFSVIPSFVQEEIWTRITEDAGGFYDPLTGELDQDRFDTGVEQFRAELQTKQAPDAVLYPHVWSAEVDAALGKAIWDGVSESGSYRLGNVVLVRSYVVVIEDPEGTPLYVNGGGLHLAERWDSAQREIVGVPVHGLCAAPERIVQAVAIALGPLIERGAEER